MYYSSLPMSKAQLAGVYVMFKLKVEETYLKGNNIHAYLRNVFSKTLR